MAITFYYGSGSPYAWRVWLALEHKRLRHLCRYITRPAIANERLQRHHNGHVVLQLKSPYHDGTTHIVMEPLEFVASDSPRSSPVRGCISSASMACSHPTLNCVPRLSRAPEANVAAPD